MQQARENKPSAKLKAENQKGNADLSQQFCCCRMACLLDWREASKIRRETLKAIESVSLMDIDLVVLGKPKERERLSSLRA